MGAFLAKLILPTVSSLVLLPTASVATKRGFHSEALVYFFTMFFTTILHVCEGPGLSIVCFMRHEVLEYFTVYGTALSMWVTLIALGDFDEPRRSSITMFGVLTIAVRTYQDRYGYGVYSGPIGSAVFIVTVTWLQKMKEIRGVYPDKKVYTQQVGPGCCFGALALMLRFYFEEWDYSYVHSFYHLSLAISFVLLLPKKNRYAGSGRGAAKLGFLTLCCCVHDLPRVQQGQEEQEGPTEGGEDSRDGKDGEDGEDGEEGEEGEKGEKEKKERSIWTIPTEKPWGQPCKTHILPLFHHPSKTLLPSSTLLQPPCSTPLLHPPSTPLKGTNISKLKEMNGWKLSGSLPALVLGSSGDNGSLYGSRFTLKKIGVGADCPCRDAAWQIASGRPQSILQAQLLEALEVLEGSGPVLVERSLAGVPDHRLVVVQGGQLGSGVLVSRVQILSLLSTVSCLLLYGLVQEQRSLGLQTAAGTLHPKVIVDTASSSSSSPPAPPAGSSSNSCPSSTARTRSSMEAVKSFILRYRIPLQRRALARLSYPC
ncbi:Protein myomaker [Merluccius polli]|uniref:Protein myomaker n=1 Tax=Merluccius polli TaxID=89951 RepID=A0AA47P9Y6_MERPO|nr:Protein myomaker [Merluccius polli]